MFAVHTQKDCSRDIFIANFDMDRVKRIWNLSPMRAAKVQASLRIRAVSPEPPLLTHTSSESRGTFRQKARSLAPLNGWACAVKVCHDGMLEDTNSLDGAHIYLNFRSDVQSRWNFSAPKAHSRKSNLQRRSRWQASWDENYRGGLFVHKGLG